VLGALCVLACAHASSQDASLGEDRALSVAREIAARVAEFPNFRASAPFGTWEDHPERTWSIRATAECHAALDAAGIAFIPVRTRLTPIPAPVRVESPVGGVLFRKMHRPGAVFVVACEMAARMPAIARVLAEHDVVETVVSSAWRREPATSFHTMGLALDVEYFVLSDGSRLTVLDDFVIPDATPTCAEPATELPARAAALRDIACDLAESGVLSTVITPAYSTGHRNHFHLDARPDDPRLFVR
jgi:hypothetical protein